MTKNIDREMKKAKSQKTKIEQFSDLLDSLTNT